MHRNSGFYSTDSKEICRCEIEFLMRKKRLQWLPEFGETNEISNEYRQIGHSLVKAVDSIQEPSQRSSNV